MSVHVYSESPSPLGTSTYLFDNVNAPAQWIPSITFTAARNKTDTNTNVTVKTEYPLLTTVDGVTTNKNTFVASVHFTALRSVVNDTERARALDETIAFLTAHRESILHGSVRAIPPVV